MGPYCMFCDHRCLVERRLPSNARIAAGHVMLMATCKTGKAYDLRSLGYDADTAINERELVSMPAWETDPEQYERMLDLPDLRIHSGWISARSAFTFALAKASQDGLHRTVRKDGRAWRVEVSA